MKIGSGTAYYGGADPRHLRATLRGFLDAGIPHIQIKGCAYPEMARCHITAQAMEFGVDCLILVDHDVEFDAADAVRMAKKALELDAIVTATLDASKVGRDRRGSPELEYAYVSAKPWAPDFMNDLAFAAIPLSALGAMAKDDAREYSNSPIVRTMLSKENRPFFSPWRSNPGTLKTEPIEGNVYCNPDRAFLLRAQAAGVPIVVDPTVRWRSLSGSGYSVKIVPGSKTLRAEHGIPNYVLCVPTFGALDLNQQAQIFELEKCGVSIAELHNCPFIDLARAELTRIAFEYLEADGMFFLDHDIGFIPRDVVELCRQAEETRDVVAAPYCMRKSAHSVIGAIDESDAPDGNVVFFEGGRRYKALYAGLGFAAIPSSVIDALSGQYPLLEAGMPGEVRPLYALDVNGGYYSGEDVSFCSRVQGLSVRTVPVEPGEDTPNGMDWEHVRTADNPTGRQVWLDTRVRIFHKGSYEYGIEDEGIVVPRYRSIDAKMCRTREEVRATLKQAQNLPIADQMRAMGLDDGAKIPHTIIDENEKQMAEAAQ